MPHVTKRKGSYKNNILVRPNPAKAYSRQAKLDRLKLFSRLGFQPQAGEQFQDVKLSLTAMALTRVRAIAALTPP
jgi:phage terminase small subunit